MTLRTIKKALNRLNEGGPYYHVNGGIRSKKTMQSLRLRRTTFFNMIVQGHVVIKGDGLITITGEGAKVMHDGRNGNLHARQHYSKMKTGGWSRRSLWIHEDDLEKFEEFKTCLKKR